MNSGGDKSKIGAGRGTKQPRQQGLTVAAVRVFGFNFFIA
jgi:hypothetical protein